MNSRDNTSPQERVDALWNTYVNQEFPDRSIASSDERYHAAIDVLGMCRQIYDEAVENGDLKLTQGALLHGRATWALLSLEIGSWTSEDPCISLKDEDWSTRTRSLLQYLLARHEVALLPFFREAIDPVPLMLPRWLFAELQRALAALDDGEVHQLVEPAKQGRHTKPWTWTQARLRALEHVGFLVGKGVTKSAARAQVKLATGIAVGTLRSWETDWRANELDCGRLQVAHDAGVWAALREADPDKAKQSVDAHAYALFFALTEHEPLHQFGRWYRGQRFGSRHWAEPISPE